MALQIQEPHIKQGVSMCTAGKEGSGKSVVLVEFLGRIIGKNHFIHIQNIKDLTVSG